MGEVAFCKQFLTALDSRPIKLSSDHVADPRQYPAQPAFILPKLPHPPHPQRPSKPTSTGAPSTPSASTNNSTISITLKPTKTHPLTPPLTLPSISTSTTSIYDLKSAYGTTTSLPISKIKILYKKKPVPDSKTISEVLGLDSNTGGAEFGVMILGGLPSTPVTSPPATTPSEGDKGLAEASASGPGSENVNVELAAQDLSGKEVIASQEFWDDLKGFIVQRIRDVKEGERLVGVFKNAWESSR
ncbi:hypothetical protein GQ43DRAFT_478819 [Delitschia confertaspora ATCC 74209]|uniref:Ubiquitin-like domain-containing protein n=1 Tax=Delitschia confertaspora ATCC 74209 TaxID=1513339 RepID=A0A9P4JQI3_9PLEO|nr:hypothetical protein GQ43DRAFT_478819 [Delitschia confertaspora ATCC 74209]